MKKFYTADLHFNDNRFDKLFRPFKTIEEQHETIIRNWNSVVSPEDKVYIVGDLAVNADGVKFIDQLNGTKVLFLGNYDEQLGASKEEQDAYREELYKNDRFEIIWPEGNYEFVGQGGNKRMFWVNHYPSRANKKMLNLVGHIHGAWKVQNNMINVGLESWNYTPVSEDQILYLVNAMENHYDENVFAGNLEANIPFKVIYTGEAINIMGPSIFLAGPTPRDPNTKSWRPEFIQTLKEAGFRGTIITPEPKEFIDKYDYDKQVEWEDEGLTKANTIVFWVPRDLENMPGFTTNIEFGQWMNSGKCVLGYPKPGVKMNYLHYKANKFNMPVYHTVKEMCMYLLATKN